MRAELDLDVAASAPEPEPAPVPVQRAQAIECGAHPVAVPYAWARAIVEDFQISAAPHAPAWLAGAVNIDGRIVPVIDLAAWIDPGAAQELDRRSRLLVGGEAAGVMALLFRGLPHLVRYTPGGAVAGVPAAKPLEPFVVARAGGADGRDWPVIDVASLGEAWVAELAV